MKKIISISLILAVAFGWTINLNQACTCNEYLQFSECTQSGCQWNTASNTCQDYTCNNLDMNSCMSAKNCYFNTTTCLKFTSCSNIPSNSSQICDYAGCSYINGSTCSDFSCTNFNNATCPSYCLLNGSSCQNPQSCSQYTVANCPIGLACQVSGQSCVPATCSQMNPNECFFVQTSLSSESIQPCYRNANYTCQDAEPSNLNTTQSCFWNTAGFYHWSSQDANRGRCVSCSQQKAYPNYLSYSNMLVSILTIAIVIA